MLNSPIKKLLASLFIASVAISCVSCNEDTPPVADSSNTTTAPTTIAPVTSAPWDGDYDSLESPYHSLYYFGLGQNISGYDSLPEGYTHPENTHPFYIDKNIYLPEDFYRPDLIWGCIRTSFGYSELYHYPFSYDNLPLAIPIDTSYPDAKYAISIQKGISKYNQAFKEGVLELGWEFVEDRETKMIFAATLDQIVWLGANFDTFQNETGYHFGKVTFSGAQSNYESLYWVEPSEN